MSNDKCWKEKENLEGKRWLKDYWFEQLEELPLTEMEKMTGGSSLGEKLGVWLWILTENWLYKSYFIYNIDSMQLWKRMR